MLAVVVVMEGVGADDWEGVGREGVGGDGA